MSCYRAPFPFFSTFDDGDVALGWLRVSRRALDEDASSPQQPIYLHQRDEPLQAGEVVPVEIEIWPSGTLFRAGGDAPLGRSGTRSARLP
jgi:predicted acyl esterase